MAELGINTVRIYTPPRRDLLDEAARTACASWSGCRGRSTSRFSTIGS